MYTYYDEEYVSVKDMGDKLKFREDDLSELLKSNIDFDIAVDRARNMTFRREHKKYRVYKGKIYDSTKDICEKHLLQYRLVMTLIGHGLFIDEIVENGKNIIFEKSNGVSKTGEYSVIIDGVRYDRKQDVMRVLNIDNEELNQLINKYDGDMNKVVKKCLNDQKSDNLSKYTLIKENQRRLKELLEKDFLTVNGMVFLDVEMMCNFYGIKLEDLLYKLALSSKIDLEHTVNKLRRAGVKR